MRLYLPAEQQVHMLQDEALALPSHRLKSGHEERAAPRAFSSGKAPTAQRGGGKVDILNISMPSACDLCHN